MCSSDLGPASARFGSNAVHGLINVLSAAPTLESEGELRVRVGPHGLRNVFGTTSGGDGNHAARASFVLSEDDGYRANSGFGQQKVQLRYDYRGAQDYIRATLSGQTIPASSWLASIIAPTRRDTPMP